MAKLLLSLLFIITITQNAKASEKAFAILLSYGFNANDLVNVVAKYPELKNIDVASESYQNAGEEFTAHLNLKLYSENTNEAYLISKKDSIVTVDKVDVELEREVRNIDGQIHNTLYETVLRETDSVKLANLMSEAFKEDFTTTKGIRVSTLCNFQVEQFFDNGRFVKYGNIVSASLVIGHAVSKKILQMDPTTFSWMLLPENFDSNDKPFYAPVKSSRVSSLFQLNRRHPITRRHQPHNGIDFVALSGTAVFPAQEGEVTAISRARAKGKFITVLHDNGYITTYDHLKKFQKGLKVGMRVALDDQIGEVGRTGFSTGAHLHFGVMKDGFYVNPIYLLKSYCFSQKEEFENLFEILDEGEE
ncbi:MAG: M23 family metallopeptidase [Bacteriovorax sp.]|nr:M23 family metallopeptidase [Bacteriovorax sp.]